MDAVSLWFSNRAECEKKYGIIGEWDTSEVTIMSYLFNGRTKFNEDISKWNVSSVTDMDSMFSGATSFNQSLSTWNVSSVTDNSNMFYGATSFNQSLESFDVSIPETLLFNLIACYVISYIIIIALHRYHKSFHTKL